MVSIPGLGSGDDVAEEVRLGMGCLSGLRCTNRHAQARSQLLQVLQVESLSKVAAVLAQVVGLRSLKGTIDRVEEDLRLRAGETGSQSTSTVRDS